MKTDAPMPMSSFCSNALHKAKLQTEDEKTPPPALRELTPREEGELAIELFDNEG
jgi:hypothetical protein